jgi:hypothetical protein
MQRKYPVELENQFGNDLHEIFGTEEEQAKKIDLHSIAGNTTKIDEIIALVLVQSDVRPETEAGLHT